MGAYMKWRYAGQSWIKEMPTITQPGTYTLLPLSQSAENSCYRVNSTNPNEYYVLEYRKKEGRYEKNLIRSGLLIYVIMEDDKLTFDINSIPTGLENLSDNRKIQLLFNEGILYVTADTNVDHIIVVDISGKILEDVKNVTQLSLKHLSKGTYIVSVLSGNDIYKRKIFIE